MTGGELVAGAAVVRSAIGASAKLGGDAEEKKQLSEIAKDSKALEVAAQARADRVAIRQMALTKLLSPLANWVGYRSEYFEKQFNKDLAEKLADTPEDQLVSPSPVVAAQAMEGLSYSLDEPELKDMYLNLLARASDARTRGSSHPSFAQVIKQLSPEESSRLLEILKTGPYGIPMVRIKINTPGGTGYHILRNHVLELRNVATREPVEDPRIAIYVDNWARLGLVTVEYQQFRVGDNAYAWHESRPEFLNARASRPDEEAERVTFDKGLLIPTDFGLRFAEAVDPN
ncbi:DUF4393 domain-containing protein [Promicromonospora panici]|uniref:DUF4393 domain-containing protein n=1 Tax=Promicromonospora panici TaxID=2219658 RepID=UPI00101DA752|nr:DUF4393 domain-containing protein [Promicromonospora panici]